MTGSKNHIRMKFKRSLFPLILLTGSLFPSCQQGGMVNEEMLRETINCTRIAVTPHQPAWVSEQKDIHLLSAADLLKVKSILRNGDARYVAEKYYRDEEGGNRDDSSSELFYLYGDNAQCLGGRVVNEQVYMDDLDIEEAQRIELYNILKPYLKKLPKDPE